MTARSLVERVRAGDLRAIARAITLVENDDPSAPDLIRGLFPFTGGAYLAGVTGPPGAGKSTLVDRLAAALRSPEGANLFPGRQPGVPPRVGVLAIDPTSPYSGGAVLGDRLRMSGHASDAGVFIRSMATRGHLGGLSRATGDAALILDAAGYDVVMIETVGVGQDEVEIVGTADVSIVALVPGTGDDVQALKAGVMEIADIFVVNKADREGADRLAAAIDATQSLRAYGEGEWRPPIVRTTATSGRGITELVDAVASFRKHQNAARASGMPPRASRERARTERRVRELLVRRVSERLAREVPASEFEAVVGHVVRRDLDPYAAADQLLRRVLRDPASQVAGHAS